MFDAWFVARCGSATNLNVWAAALHVILMSYADYLGLAWIIPFGKYNVITWDNKLMLKANIHKFDKIFFKNGLQIWLHKNNCFLTIKVLFIYLFFLMKFTIACQPLASGQTHQPFWTQMCPPVQTYCPSKSVQQTENIIYHKFAVHHVIFSK